MEYNSYEQVCLDSLKRAMKIVKKTNTFVVDIQGHGRINRKQRNKANISFKRGVINLSDHKTFNKCLNRLKKV